MTPVSKLESRRGKVEGLGFTSQLQQILPFRYQNVSHESRTNSTRLMFTPRWDTGRSAVSKVPLAFLWARLCAARRCWIPPGFSCEFFEPSKPVVQLLKWPHKRGNTCNHGCLKHIVYIYCIYIPFYWFVWCVIFSSNTQPMTCPLQVLMKANAIKANSTDTSISVSKPAPWTHIPSPQDHTFCGSTISYLGWFRNCHSQNVYLLYQVQQDLGYYVLWKQPTHSSAL